MAFYTLEETRDMSQDERAQRINTAYLRQADAGVRWGTLACCGAKEFHGLNTNYEDWRPEQIFDAMHHRARAIWTGRIRCDYAVLFMNHRHIDHSCSATVRARMSQDFYTQRGKLRSRKLIELQKWIKEHRLGTLSIGDPVVNPNSGNTLIPAMWVVNVPRAHALMSFRQGRRRTWPR